VLGDPRLQADHRQAVAEHVVHLAGDAQAFLGRAAPALLLTRAPRQLLTGPGVGREAPAHDPGGGDQDRGDQPRGSPHGCGERRAPGAEVAQRQQPCAEHRRRRPQQERHPSLQQDQGGKRR
jgi:hypothetical protein